MITVNDKEINNWHTLGNKDVHYDEDREKSISQLINRCKKDKLCVRMGNTGYLDRFEKELPKDSLIFDVYDDGRKMFLIKDYFLFQRYINGNTYLVNGKISGFKPVNNDLFNLLIGY